MFEHHVAPIAKYVVAAAEYNLPYSESPTPQMYYLQ
jgi:hypothetical protein